MTPMKEEISMSARMNEVGMAMVNMMPLWELQRDYKELHIFYICEDGKAVDIGTEPWEE